MQPFGGLRLWNEYDAIPYVALLVGYQHAGVPLKVGGYPFCAVPCTQHTRHRAAVQRRIS